MRYIIRRKDEYPKIIIKFTKDGQTAKTIWSKWPDESWELQKRMLVMHNLDHYIDTQGWEEITEQEMLLEMLKG